MTLEVVVETLIKAVIVIGALLTGFAYLTLFERKVQARMQQRPGPNRVGPWGLLQPAADGLKLYSWTHDGAPVGHTTVAAGLAAGWLYDQQVDDAAGGLIVLAAALVFVVTTVSGPRFCSIAA